MAIEPVSGKFRCMGINVAGGAMPTPTPAPTLTVDLFSVQFSSVEEEPILGGSFNVMMHKDQILSLEPGDVYTLTIS